jgi:hypothetical protein
VRCYYACVLFGMLLCVYVAWGASVRVCCLGCCYVCVLLGYCYECVLLGVLLYVCVAWGASMHENGMSITHENGCVVCSHEVLMQVCDVCSYEGLTRSDIPHGVGVMIFGFGTGAGFSFHEVKQADMWVAMRQLLHIFSVHCWARFACNCLTAACCRFITSRVNIHSQCVEI